MATRRAKQVTYQNQTKTIILFHNRPHLLPTMNRLPLPAAMFVKLILLPTLFITVAESLQFSFPTFKSIGQDNNLILQNSYIVLDSLQVTPALTGSSLNYLSGRALYKHPVKLWGKRFGRHGRIRASFNSTFIINIARQTKQAGEGMAFILTADSTLPDNSQWKWLGIVNQTTDGNPEAKIVAIEFDTRKNPGDVDDNHLGLDLNSVSSIRQVPLEKINLSDGDDIRVLVLYDGGNLTVFVGKKDVEGKPILSERIDLSDYLPRKVFVGFSGSTSKYTELNRVKSWEFCSSDVDEYSGLLYVSILVPLGLVILIGVAIFWYWKWWRPAIRCDEEEVMEEIQWQSTAPRMVKLKQLTTATENFNPQNELGKGGFGIVYRGILNFQVVAIKRFISESSQHGRQEFVTEVTTIGNLHHKNLVKLIGWCHEGQEFLLVYEFMSNGSLDKLLFSTQKESLSWGRRLSIINGVAQALDYLHNGCDKRVLHRDIKASNILLDSEFNAKLGDFGLARTLRQREQTHHSTKEIAGTPGYMAPECFLTGQATMETDVYAFGVLLLEVVCGRRAAGGNRVEEGNGIVCWAWELYRAGRLVEGVDRRMKCELILSEGEEEEEEEEEEEVVGVLILGLACCHPNPRRRPTMKSVIQVLTREGSPPVVPVERPAFVWPAEGTSSDCSTSGSHGTPFSEVSLKS